MTIAGSPEHDVHELRHADAEVAERTPSMLRRIDRRLTRATAQRERVGAAADRLARSRLDHADHAADTAYFRTVRDRPPGVGHEADARNHGLSPVAYVIIMALAGGGAWLVDQGALLILELPLHLTQAIAVLLVLVKLAAAHWGGHILRRRHQCIDARHSLGMVELALGWACVIGGLALSVVVGAVRTILGGGLGTGALFALVGVVDFLVALVASYAYANDAVTAHNRARRQERRRARRVTRDTRALLRAVARWRSACLGLVSATTAVVAEFDTMRTAGRDTFRRNHPHEPDPDWPEPAWIAGARDVAAGNLPAQLDLRPVLLTAGINPDEVL